MAGSIPEAEYERFFRDARPHLLGQAYLLSGNSQEAQDLVQEALLRAWENWGRVRHLDDPQAWARHVLHNLAVSQWRRRRLQLSRRVPAASSSTEGPGVGHLEVAAAIRTLPIKQRRALVLRAVVGLSTAQVAAELDAPESTVRVWLMRARSSVAVALGRDSEYRRGGKNVTSR